jgi:hypothetical protein
MRIRNRNEAVFAVGLSDVCPVQGPCPVRAVSSLPAHILPLIPKVIPKPGYPVENDLHPIRRE